MSSGLSALPDGWMRARVGDLVDLIRGVTYPKDRASSEPKPGYLPILRATNISDELNFEDLVFVPEGLVSASQRLLAWDLVIAASSGSKSVVGKAAQLRGSWVGSFGAFCMGLRPSKAMEPRFLKYYFQTREYRATVSDLAAGSNINNLKREHIAELRLSLPPIAEQRRIADRLDELLSDLEAGRVALVRARATLKRYRASVLKAAVEGRLTAAWREAHPDVEPASRLLERILAERRKRWEERQLAKFAEAGKAPPKGWQGKYPEPVTIDASELPDLPNGWCWVSLDQIAELVGGITKGQKRAGGEEVRSVAYLRVANVQRGFLDFSEIKTIEATPTEISEMRLQVGDILFNEGGDRDKLGRGWVWEGQIEECIHQNHVFRARLVLPELNPRLVSMHGNTFGKLWFQRAGKQSVNLASINLSILRRFPVPLAPLKEQAEIGDCVDEQLRVLDRNAAEIELQARRVPLLRQVILRRAFEGRLVPQNPKDEPASILLERIRSARLDGASKSSGSARKPARKARRVRTSP